MIKEPIKLWHVAFQKNKIKDADQFFFQCALKINPNSLLTNNWHLENSGLTLKGRHFFLLPHLPFFMLRARLCYFLRFLYSCLCLVGLDRCLYGSSQRSTCHKVSMASLIRPFDSLPDAFFFFEQPAIYYWMVKEKNTNHKKQSTKPRSANKAPGSSWRQNTEHLTSITKPHIQMWTCSFKGALKNNPSIKETTIILQTSLKQ